MSEIDLRIKERKHRLHADAYLGSKTVITISVRDRKPLFAEEQVVEKFVVILGAKASLYKCDVPIYCFTPDHLHLLVPGLEEDSQPKQAVDKFKRSAGIWLTHRPEFRLQKNPVRARLVEDPFGFPFTGCIGLERSRMLEEVFFG